VDYVGVVNFVRLDARRVRPKADQSISMAISMAISQAPVPAPVIDSLHSVIV